MKRKEAKKITEALQANLDELKRCINELKPKPLEFWINIYKNGGHSHSTHKSEEDAIRRADPGYQKTIKLREVLTE